MHAGQQGVCAICKKEEIVVAPNTGRVRRLAVDHCHRTNEIRGLLCKKCNLGIHPFDGDMAWLRNALNYLGESL